MTKLGFVRSPLLVQQKCQLPIPHKFGSRVPSLLTEIEISRSAIMKNDNFGFCAFPVARTAGNAQNPILSFFIMAEREISISVNNDGTLDPNLWGVGN